MSGMKVIAVLLILFGALSLAYGGFTYVEDTHDASLGPIDISVQDKETVNIPAWAGVASIIVGAGLAIAKWKGSGGAV